MDINDLFEPQLSAVEKRKNSIRATFERMATSSAVAARAAEYRRKEALRPKKRETDKPKPPNFNHKTKDLLHERGFLVVQTESYNAYSQRKSDLMGFADFLAIHAGQPAVAVQVTSVSNLASRRNKIRDSKLAQTWLQTGNRILLIGWYKEGSRWQAKEEWL